MLSIHNLQRWFHEESSVHWLCILSHFRDYKFACMWIFTPSNRFPFFIHLWIPCISVIKQWIWIAERVADKTASFGFMIYLNASTGERTEFLWHVVNLCQGRRWLYSYMRFSERNKDLSGSDFKLISSKRRAVEVPIVAERFSTSQVYFHSITS